MRFKTLEEFKKEFGDSWHYQVKCNWNTPKMDYLFGKELTPQQEVEFLKSSASSKVRLNVDQWSISEDMITTSDTPISLPNEISLKDNSTPSFSKNKKSLFSF